MASKIKMILFQVFVLLLSTGMSHPNYGQNIPGSGQYSNPANIYGSDFLRVFQQYYKQGDFEMLMRLTSSQSIKQYGQDSILALYKEMDFGYHIRLKSMKKTAEGFEMNYGAIIQATKVVIRCRVVVERDTCRLELPLNPYYLRVLPRK